MSSGPDIVGVLQAPHRILSVTPDLGHIFCPIVTGYDTRLE